MTVADLESKTMTELYKIGRGLEIPRYYQLHKKELILQIMKAQAEKDGLIHAQGILEKMPDGYGFLRPVGYLPSAEDMYVSPSQIRKFDLRTGDCVAGQVRKPKDSEKYYALLRVESVNNVKPELSPERSHFEGLTPIYPQERITLETGEEEMATRMIDLIAPLRKDNPLKEDCQQYQSKLSRYKIDNFIN
jgi:transcription termination factor Rho